MITRSRGNGPKAGISNSLVFHKIPTVEFDFAAISIMVCDVSIVTSGKVGEGSVGADFYPYTLLLDHVPEK